MQALKREHRSLVEPALREAFADSIDIDAAFEHGHENENRWDYLLGHGERKVIIGLEPHTASNHEVTTVIAKRRAALDHLRDHLRPQARIAEWFWVASGSVDLTPLDKAQARLDQHGSRFVGKQLIRKWLTEGQATPKGKRQKRRPAG